MTELSHLISEVILYMNSFPDIVLYSFRTKDLLGTFNFINAVVGFKNFPLIFPEVDYTDNGMLWF